jgi:hypothetical protein
MSDYNQVVRHLKECFKERSIDELMNLVVDRIYVINGIVIFD